MKITQSSVDELINYEFNNKKHPERQIDLLANSIKEFGWTAPICIDEQNVIIAGHWRLLAAKKLWLDTVPTVQVENLTDAQIKKLRLLDNKISELAEDDLENITIELEELQDTWLTELYWISLDNIDENRYEVISQAKEDFNFEDNPIRHVSLHFSPEEYDIFCSSLDQICEEYEIWS